MISYDQLQLGLEKTLKGTDFAELVRFIPDDANTLVTLNVEQALKSKFAQEEG